MLGKEIKQNSTAELIYSILNDFCWLSAMDIWDIILKTRGEISFMAVYKNIKNLYSLGKLNLKTITIGSKLAGRKQIIHYMKCQENE